MSNETLFIDSVSSESVLIFFQIGRIFTFLCTIFGLFGNISLIFVLYHTASSRRVTYELLIICITVFNSIRLLSAIYYYVIHANFIPLNYKTHAIYIIISRYSHFVANWLKVLVAIERFVTIKYWVVSRHQYRKLNQQKKRRIIILIFIILVCGLLNHHPNFIHGRFISVNIDPRRLLIVPKVNLNFYYGENIFNGALFTIISYTFIDDAIPISILFISNGCLLYSLHHLPSITRQKINESIWILTFLTFFSIFLIPRSILVLFHLYVDRKYVDDTKLAIAFHLLQGK
ncbi:unnamed protein product [Didymodactylos carnosus]|uniref:G-protein coupled receptors family 1 profile domain-containing protein n=1 Tax=Didymodactylos carnosus TaxID=1234261 RepID=A0A814IV17_9BILA|nr:unnamed protein product [Didymodactylos carnosus]CAF3799712.1 unnamed protein product [Didymodactylos carnosus]